VDKILVDSLEKRIFLIRGQRVMIDEDLANLYGVMTGRLNEQVKRNGERFPKDFMFQLTNQEVRSLISQNAISSWGGRRKLPNAFTEQGVAMLSSVLRSKRAVHVNIEIMRAFVRLRGIISQSKELAHKLEELESQITTHDKAIRSLFTAIRQLMSPPAVKEKRIGFQLNQGDVRDD
jgi:hypothetical protein